MKLTDLSSDERLALGGLIRLLVRADGEFSVAEEERLDASGDALGGKELLWKAISASAQAFKTDADIRDAGLAIARPEVREVVLSVLESVARADTMSPAEASLIATLKTHWGIHD